MSYLVDIGDIAEDKLTGFKGRVVGFTDYLHNCRRFIVQPYGLKEGKPREAKSFDHPDLKLLERSKTPHTSIPPREFGLGDAVRDNLTGYTGVIVSRTEWFNQCDRYVVQSHELHDGEIVDPQSLDGDSIILIEKEIAEAKPEEAKTGGPQPEPSRR